MQVQTLMEIIGSDFYTGVPDSQLRALCDCLMQAYGIDPKHHLIGVNEGNCTALAAGYYLATGKVPVVYMQNSGQGNMINPMASLLHPDVYGIPVLFIVGWRGEPGVHDEPQHVYQGKVTLRLMEDMDILTHVIGPDTEEKEIRDVMETFRERFSEGKSCCFVIRKGALAFGGSVSYQTAGALSRERAVEVIAESAGDGFIVSTTGKASRELFEYRARMGEGHGSDFLTVGSMGHASSIALGLATQRPDQHFYVIDGDGAALMQLGAMSLIGSVRPENLTHVVIVNGAHETVGGMPTAGAYTDFVKVATACGYQSGCEVWGEEELRETLQLARDRRKLTLIAVHCQVSSRADLGRPTTKARENREAFMETLRERS
ncbi:MAG: phosphonopyruvate decarboxylase [Clostridia bacterium]|nr:phosphonopyruvate decarboxylase [Clostridia bacterium]